MEKKRINTYNLDMFSYQWRDTTQLSDFGFHCQITAAFIPLILLFCSLWKLLPVAHADIHALRNHLTLIWIRLTSHCPPQSVILAHFQVLRDRWRGARFLHHLFPSAWECAICEIWGWGLTKSCSARHVEQCSFAILWSNVVTFLLLPGKLSSM